MVGTPAGARVERETPSRRRGFVARVGAYVIEVWLRVALSVAVGLTALWRMFRPRIWRRTVRHEFVRHCWQVGIKALPAITITATIAGIALVFQVLYWRTTFGDVLTALNIGSLVVLNLVREFAPLLVGLIIIGRSATLMITELVELRVDGQIHMLEAQGIDAFDFLVVSRISALAVCSFALGVIFVVVAVASGQIVSVITGVADFGFFEFLIVASSLLTPAEYLILPLKTFSIGVLIGVVTCVTALRPARKGTEVRELLALGYTRAVVATLILSGAITAVVVA